MIDKYIYTKGQMESALRVILRTYFNIGNDENFSHCPIFTMQSVLRNSHEAAYIEGRESALINKESDIEAEESNPHLTSKEFNFVEIQSILGNLGFSWTWYNDGKNNKLLIFNSLGKCVELRIMEDGESEHKVELDALTEFYSTLEDE